MSIFNRVSTAPRSAVWQLIGGMALLAALPAAALADQSPERVEFVAQNLPRPAATDVNAVAARAVLRRFMDLHPEYTIKPFTMPQIGVDAAMDSGPLMAISAGMGPNAIYVNFRQSATYNEQGFLSPFEILLARVKSDNPAVRETDANGNWVEDPTQAEIEAAIELIRERVPERAWPVIYREDMSGRSDSKHVWSIPLSSLVHAFFYRKDLFQEAGLDPERPPRTWDELLEYARILHDPQRRRFAMAFIPGVNISYSAYPFLVADGARAMDQDENGEWRAAFDIPEMAEGIHFFWRLVREPFERDGEVIRGAAVIRGDSALLWTRGQVAMRFGSLDEEMLSTVSPQLVGIAPIPYSPRGGRGNILNARMLGVFTDSTPAQKLAVTRYIWFITGEEAQRIRTRTFVDRGYGQFVNPDLLERFGYTRLLERVPAGWIETFQDALNYGVPEPYGKNTQHIYRLMSTPINYALEQDFTNMPADQAVADIFEQVKIAAANVNTQALGIISEEEMRQRRIVASIVLLALVAAFSVGLGNIWSYFSKASPPVNWRKNKRNLIWGGMLLLPGLGLIIVWQYVPLLLGGSTIAFMDYRVVLPNVWVGVDNFANVLYDPAFWRALWREFYFVALMLGLGFWPPILLAILLQEVPTNIAKYFYRTVFYLPSVLIGIVVMFLWMQLYDPSPSGTLNQLLLSLNSLGPIPATVIKWLLLGFWLSLIGLLLWLPVKLEEMPLALKLCLWAAGLVFVAVTLSPIYAAGRDGGATESLAVLGSLFGRFELEPLRWLQDPALAMLCIIIPSVWASSGPGCIIYLAGLKSVPNELYEAAAIDGAGFWHRIFYIVLPRLKFLIVIQLIMALVSAFKGGESQILVMTGGGPNEATTTLSLLIFYRTFMDLEYGLGTAMSWFMGGILIGFTAYQLKLLSRAEFRAAG